MSALAKGYMVFHNISARQLLKVMTGVVTL